MENTVKLILLLTALLAVPTTVWGQMSQFVPKIIGFEGEAVIDMKHEKEKNLVGGTGIETTDTFFVERLNLLAVGFIYHPRFILLNLRLSEGLKEERFDEGPPDEPSWSISNSTEYDFRAKVLPRHPYNLELFTSRREPFLTGRITEGGKAVVYQKGAIFRYRKKPLFLNLSYITDSLETDRRSFDSQTLNANATYLIGLFSNSAGYSRTTSEASDNTSSRRNYYYFDNDFRYRATSLSSHINFTTSEQESPFTPSFTDDTLVWTEQLRIHMPWNFELDVNYNHFKNTFTSEETPSEAGSTLFTKSDEGGFTITHRLYYSLVTNYTFARIFTESSGGDVGTTSHFFNTTYTKKIPTGQMSVGVSMSRLLTDRTGAPLVLNETHSESIFGEFTLRSLDIDINSVKIRVRSPDTGSLVDLVKDIHFTLLTTGTATMVRITSLPLEVLSSNPFFVYEFLVSYSLLGGDVEFKTTGLGYNVKLEIFDNLLSPYYSYSRSKQEILSGSLPGGPEDSTTHTAGIIITKAPFTLLGEYQKVDSRLNPSRAWRTQLNFRKSISPTATILSSVYYSNIKYLVSPVLQAGRGFSTSAYGGSLTLQKSFPRRNLNLSVTGSYSQRSGISRTKTYSLNGLATWKVGKLDISAGATVSRSKGELSTELSTFEQELASDLFYVTIKRKLF